MGTYKHYFRVVQWKVAFFHGGCDIYCAKSGTNIERGQFRLFLGEGDLQLARGRDLEALQRVLGMHGRRLIVKLDESSLSSSRTRRRHANLEVAVELVEQHRQHLGICLLGQVLDEQNVVDAELALGEAHVWHFWHCSHCRRCNWCSRWNTGFGSSLHFGHHLLHILLHLLEVHARRHLHALGLHHFLHLHHHLRVHHVHHSRHRICRHALGLVFLRLGLLASNKGASTLRNDVAIALGVLDAH